MLRRSLEDLIREEDGQAVLEYILMLSIAVLVIGSFATGLRKVLVQIWERMAQDIAAPCPGCPPPPGMRIR